MPTAVGMPPYPQQPNQPGYGPQQPAGGGKSRGPLIAAIAGGLIVVAAAVVAAVLVAGGDSGDADEARPQASASADRTPGDDGRPDAEESPGDAEPSAPAGSGGLVDPVHGISLPLLEGWERLGSGPTGAVMGTGPYPCPADASKSCLKGGVMTLTAIGYTADDAEGIAKEDIARNAEESYSPDAHGGISTKEELASETVTVAGQQGYRVRWKIVNKQKPDAYVESVAFPAPSGGGRMVLLRFGFDIIDGAPALSDIERIIEGAKAVEGDRKRDPNEV